MEKTIKYLLIVLFLSIYSQVKGQNWYLIHQNVNMSYGTNTSGELIYELADGNNSYFFHYGSTLYDNSQIYFSSDNNLNRIELRYGRAGINSSFCNLGTTKYIDLTEVCSPYLAYTESYVDDCTDLTAGIAFVKLGTFKPVVTPISPIPFCEPQSVDFFEETTFCSLGQIRYAIEYSLTYNGIFTELLPYGEHDPNFNFTPANIPGLNPGEQIFIKVRKSEFQSQNLSDYIGGTVTYNIVDCSPTLVGNPLPTNETCYGNNDGSVTLNFDRNVDTAKDYEMRFFVYQGSPSDFTGKPDDVFPPLPFDELRIGELINNGNGTFSGTSNQNLESGDYYIVYQEVLYDPNGVDVIVKGGKITPNSFRIESPSPIVASGSISAPQTCGDTAKIAFSAIGGDNLDSSGSYTYQYRLNGGEWFLAEQNPQHISLGTMAQNVEVKAFYSVGNCESDPVLLNSQITAAPPSLSFENPNPGIASSSNSNDGVISVKYNGGTPNYTFELTKENVTTLDFESITNPILIHNDLNQTVEFQELGVGTYKITITDSNGCNLTSENIEVETIPPPQIVDQQANQILCPNGNDGNITLSISEGITPYNYQWTINGVISPIQTTGNQTISLNNLSEPGEYILKVASTGFTDFNDPSGYDSTTITLNIPEEVIINSATQNNISCFGAQDGSIAIIASGGLSYEYKLDFFDTWKPLNNGLIPITNGGFYDVYLRNQNNCEADPIMGVLVTEPDELTVTSTSENAITNGGNEGGITLNILGGTPFSAPAEPYAISWNKDGQPFTPPTGSTSSNLIDLEAGEYTAQISDANGCSPLISLPIIIDEPGPLEINSISIQQEISCIGAADGIVSANVTGTSPITFEWRLNGATFRTLTDENTLSDIGPGDYQLFLNDGSLIDPLESEVITIASPLPITATADISPVSCFGGNDGRITINASGGTGILNYNISGLPEQTSPIFDNLITGTYSITITDENNCTSVPFDVFVPEPTAIQISDNSIIPVSVAGGDDGAITLTIIGGTEPYGFTWSGPNGYTNTTMDITSLEAGTYSLEIRDINGCFLSQDFEVSEPGPLAVNSL
ncbi:MAG TPA: hypothetical protein DIT95_05085, partial [Arenibacter sp.]|nr:hypothetical protein [Arenibacter sp.]